MKYQHKVQKKLCADHSHGLSEEQDQQPNAKPIADPPAERDVTALEQQEATMSRFVAELKANASEAEAERQGQTVKAAAELQWE